MPEEKVASFLHEFTAWASDREDILAVALVGSYAKNTASEDSDIDLVILAAQPGLYLENIEWVRQFGNVCRHQIEDYGRLTSLRVWYNSGIEVEYGLTSRDWAALPLDKGTQAVISGGMQILFERGA